MRGRRDRKGSAGPLLAALAFLLLISGCAGCMGPVEVPGNCGTDIPDPDEDLAGCIIDGEENPVAGVLVTATRVSPGPAKVSSAGIPLPDSFSTKTDERGRYSFRGLEDGRYIVTGTYSTDHVLKPEEWKVGRRQLTMPVDVLYKKGLIRVKVVDTSFGIPWTDCDVPGISPVYRTDTHGKLEIAMAPGKWELRCVAADSRYLPYRDSVEVQSNEATEVTVNMTMPEVSRPPHPTSATAEYDPVTGIVHLKWPKVKWSTTVIYWVRRIDPTLNLPTTIFTQDTFYSDAIYWPRSDSDGVLAKPKTITYNVGSALPSNNLQSTDWTVLPVAVDPPLFLGPLASVRSGDSDSVYQVGDTARFIGEYRNPFRSNKSLSWTLEGIGTELKPARSLSDSAGQDTLYYPCTKAGTFRVRMTVTDYGGARATPSLPFEVKDP